MQMYGHFEGFALHTVDGRNPAPPDMFETVQTMAYLHIFTISTGERRISSINISALFGLVI